MMNLFIPLFSASLASRTSGVVTDGRTTVSDAVVWLVGGEASRPGNFTISQKNKRFIPHVLAVPKGSTVNFPNDDSIFHNVFAEYNARKFDLGMYPKGTSKSVTFDKVGTVSILCNVHCEMSAYVVIVDTPYFATTDSRGKFEIKNVPAGTYTMHVWHETGKQSVESVKVTADSTTLNAVIKR